MIEPLFVTSLNKKKVLKQSKQRNRSPKENRVNKAKRKLKIKTLKKKAAPDSQSNQELQTQPQSSSSSFNSQTNQELNTQQHFASSSSNHSTNTKHQRSKARQVRRRANKKRKKRLASNTVPVSSQIHHPHLLNIGPLNNPIRSNVIPFLQLIQNINQTQIQVNLQFNQLSSSIFSSMSIFQQSNNSNTTPPILTIRSPHDN
jgi:hypothetical protein